MAGNADRIITARVAGMSLVDTAAAAGCSVSTVQRALRDPEVQAAIREARQEARDGEIREWKAMQGEARVVLRALLRSRKEAMRLRAAIQVLRSAEDAQFMHNLMRRQAAIDEAILRDAAENHPGEEPA